MGLSEVMEMSDNWQKFKRYAIEHGVHNGPVSLAALHRVWHDNKGSRYHTIVTLYKAVGTIMQQQEFEREMGCAACIKAYNDDYRNKTEKRD